MDVKANSLYQEMQMMAMQAGAGPAPVQRMEVNPAGSEFSDMLSQAINNVNGLQGESRELQKRFEMGDPDLSLVDVMVAKEKSGIAFEATVQVRNKLLEAYKTIMNMPV
ncbi:flagellar hook-basal body complex protein FliE [Glaciecola siphonariae]|uniref:Flagellar hook-basal body complex protein FliE n=1 Tax=Glaciecola siphonariae TaxID=521012 RepID=A0ABV9LVD6_9ALTE